MRQCSISDKTHLKSFLKTCLSVTRDRAETILRDSLSVKSPPMGDKDLKFSENIYGVLSGEKKLEDFNKNVTIPVFNEVFRSENGHFTFNFDGKTVCDIDKNNLQKEIWPKKIRDAEEFLEKAKQTGDKTKIQLAEKKLHEAQRYAPKLFVGDFINAVRREIIRNGAGEDAVKRLALFLASGTTSMPPVAPNGRRLCGATNSHYICNVSGDGTCTFNQTFDKVRDFCNQGIHCATLGVDTKASNLKPPLREVWRETYTETTLEVEYKFKAIGDREPTAEIKKFQQDVKFVSDLGTDEKLSLLHDNHAQTMLETEQGVSPLSKELFEDSDFLSEVIKDDTRTKEFIRDFCSLNKREATKQLQYAMKSDGIVDKERQMKQQGKVANLHNYFLGKENRELDFHSHLFDDFNRGWNFGITVDGREIFTGKHTAANGEKITKREFLAQIKEAIKEQSDETKEKIADFIVNSASQGYILLPLYRNSSTVGIGSCTPTLELNINTKNSKTDFTIGGTYRDNMGTAGATVFMELGSTKRSMEIGQTLNQQVDFKFRYGYNGLLANNNGKLDTVDVERFEQTITDNVPGKSA